MNLVSIPPFQRLLLTRPPERNSEGTRFDVWMRTDDGVKFIGTAELVSDIPSLACGERIRGGHVQCEGPKGHTGAHSSGNVAWGSVGEGER